MYAYTRMRDGETFLIVVNLSGAEEAVTLPNGLDMAEAELVLANDDAANVPPPARGLALAPYDARVYRLARRGPGA